ncbi:MAG: extracellular solute-binding protein [Chloroflexota bacterium]
MLRYSSILLLLSMLLFACAPAVSDIPQNTTPLPAANDTSVTTITFGAYDQYRDYFEPLIRHFNAENEDMQVIFVDLSDTIDLQEANQDFLRAVVSAADTAFTYVSSEDIAKDYLFDLNPLIDADVTFDIDDYYPSAFVPLSTDGGLYVLPTIAEAPLIAYNKTLVEQAGIEVPDEPSWRDLHEMARILAQREGATVETYGLMTGDLGLASFLAQLEQAGIDPFATPREQLNLEQPAYADAVEETQAMLEAGILWHAKSQPNLFSEEEGFVISVPDTLSELAREQRIAFWHSLYFFPSLSNGALPFEIGYIPEPTLSLPQYLPGQEGYVISSGTFHPQAAWRWLSFLANYMPLAEQGYRVSEAPARRSVAEQNPVWRNQQEDYIKAFRAALERPSTINPDIDPMVWQALRNLWDDTVQGDESIDTMLQTAQAAISQEREEPDSRSEPIVVATPVILAEGTQVIEFGTLGIIPDLKSLTRRFAEEYPDMYVEPTTIDDNALGEGTAAHFAHASADVDCFAWDLSPPNDKVTTTLNLRPFIEGDAAFPRDDYPPALLGYFEREGGIYGLPLSMRLRALAYNEDHFQSVDFAPPPADMTLDDFLALVQQMTRRDGTEQKYGYALPFGEPRDLWLFLDQFDAPLSQNSSQGPVPNFTDPTMVRALTYYVDLLRQYSPHGDLPGYDDSIMIGYVNSGQSAMWMTDSAWGGLSRDADDPDAISVGLVPPPRDRDTIGPSDVIIQGTYISPQSEHPEACWEWLKFLSNHSTFMNPGSFPARRSLAQSPTFLSQASPRAAELYEDYLPRLNDPTALSEQDLFNTPFFDPFWLYRAVDRAIQGRDLAEELAIAEKLTNEYLQCVRQDGEPRECAEVVDPTYDGKGPRK